MESYGSTLERRQSGPRVFYHEKSGADIGQLLTELMVEAIGLYSCPDQSQLPNPIDSNTSIGPTEGNKAFERYFNYRASSIAGGT